MEKPRILSVDDEVSFTEMLKSYFEPRGYEIDSAPDGDKALELLSREKYDVLLLDLKMTGLSGDEVMNEVKKLYRDTRVIFVSAYSDSGKAKERLLSKGAHAFIEKPIKSLKYLEEAVNKAFLQGPGKGSSSTLKLLVVDDEDDVCDFVENFFKERGFEIFTANSGEKALDIIDTDDPDIILLDIKMPGMDGIETLREIHRMDSSKKVIMISAIDDEKKIKEAKTYGVVEYITKPLLLEQLERTVLTVAEQIKMR